MPSRPELTAPPEFFYNQDEARKYTTSSRIIEIQAKLSERALELLAFPNDGIPRLLLDIGCGSGLSGETLAENGHHWIGLDISQSMLDVALEQEADGDLLLGDMGQKSRQCGRFAYEDIHMGKLEWCLNFLESHYLLRSVRI